MNVQNDYLVTVSVAKKQIQSRLEEIEQDYRLSLPPANVVDNAPLALEQVLLETEGRSLRWVLKLLDDGGNHEAQP